MTVSSGLADARVRLAHSLGFLHYPTSKIAQPYLKYIENQHTGDRESLQDYLNSFQRLVKSFTKENPPLIQAYIDELYDDGAGQVKCIGHEQRTDQVMISLGTWLMSLEYFRFYCGVRHVERAFCVQQKLRALDGFHVARQNTLPSLVKGGSLFPSRRVGEFSMPAIESSVVTEQLIHYTMESTSISAKRLNARTLSTLADIRIYWTKNMSRHLLLSQRDGEQFIEVFALPCVLEASSALVKAGVPESFIQEVRDSYLILFSPFGCQGHRHRRWGRLVFLSRWCRCSPCSSIRFREHELSALKLSGAKLVSGDKRDIAGDEFDPTLEVLMENGNIHISEDWSSDVFACLWPRLLQLENRLQSAKPWRFWGIFKDKRDTLQFWTFIFATLILLLTVIQVFLAAVQVVQASNKG